MTHASESRRPGRMWRLSYLVVLGALAAPAAGQPPVQPAEERRLRAMALEELTAERFERLADDHVITIGDETTTVRALRVARHEAEEWMTAWLDRAAVSAQRHLERRQRHFAEREAARRERSIAAAREAMEELRQRPRRRPVRPVARPIDGG